MKLNRLFHSLLLGLIISAGSAFGQGTTAFTYQGQLHDSGTNVNGNCNLTFALYNAPSGGNQIGGNLSMATTLVNGLFTVNLDFGAGAFVGAARWMEISVNGETLSPRVPVAPVPYALYANAAGSAGILANGSWAATVGNYQSYSNIFSISANNSFVMAFSTNGVLVNGGLQANELSVGGNYSLGTNYNGGLALYDNGNNADLTINNLTLNGSSLQFPSRSGANIQVNTNGDFTFGGNVSITSLGNITLPVPGGNVVISANNQGVSVNGVILSGTGGIILPTSDRNRVISTTTSGIVLDGVTVSQNTGVTLPNAAGNRTLLAESQGFYMNSNVRVGGYVNATAFNIVSDRDLKEQFQPVNPAEVLARVVSLPITSWNYKEDVATRHIGPMAQDFYAAFNLGMDEKHIATVDESGVALAAIQGLHAQLKAKDAHIEALEKRLAALENQLKTSAPNK